MVMELEDVIDMLPLPPLPILLFQKLPKELLFPRVNDIAEVVAAVLPYNKTLEPEEKLTVGLDKAAPGDDADPEP